MGVYHPDLRGHAKAWECITPTRGATQEAGSPSPQVHGPRKSEGVCGSEDKIRNGPQVGLMAISPLPQWGPQHFIVGDKT